jgi:NADH:ubiquinone oxidoreductase subunit C
MFGIKFLFHSNLRRILTDYGFNGHPLRKDFPLLGYFEIIYDDSKQVIGFCPVEVSQAMRFYQTENP